MTRVAHYEKAESLLGAAEAMLAGLSPKTSADTKRAVYTEANLTLQRALVHASLACMPA